MGAIMIVSSLMKAAKELPTFKAIDGNLITFGHLFESVCDATQYTNTEPKTPGHAVELLDKVLDALQWYAGLASEVGHEVGEKQADRLIRQAYQSIDYLNDMGYL
jgi:hypothetical protein